MAAAWGATSCIATNLRVDGVPIDWGEGQLKEMMEQYGPVRRLTIWKDKATSQPMGLGLVEYHDPSHAAAAMQQLEGKQLAGAKGPVHITPNLPKPGQDKGGKGAGKADKSTGGDWNCGCGFLVFASKDRCPKCGTGRWDHLGALEAPWAAPAAAAAAGVPERVQAQVPPGLEAGGSFTITWNGRQIAVPLPAGVPIGQMICIEIPRPAPPAGVAGQPVAQPSNWAGRGGGLVAGLLPAAPPAPAGPAMFGGGRGGVDPAAPQQGQAGQGAVGGGAQQGQDRRRKGEDVCCYWLEGLCRHAADNTSAVPGQRGCDFLHTDMQGAACSNARWSYNPCKKHKDRNARAISGEQGSAQDQRWYSGQVLDYDVHKLKERGYGFVACRETFAQFGKDVLITTDTLTAIGKMPGDHVEFQLYVEPSGKPQVLNARAPGSVHVHSAGIPGGGAPAAEIPMAIPEAFPALGAPTAPPVPRSVPEHRLDPADGCAYALPAFIHAYGGSEQNPPQQWLGAAVVPPESLDLSAIPGALDPVVAEPAGGTAPAPAPEEDAAPVVPPVKKARWVD